MSADTTGGPAFPVLPPCDMEGASASGYPFPDAGMTLRDYFAAQAMQSILSALLSGIRPQDCIKAAEDAYFVADSMLKARQA